MKITIELCTAGPHYKPVAAHAKKIGLDVSPHRFVRQQDIKHNGEEVFPRIWNKGKPDEAVMNGGEPGRHHYAMLLTGAAQLEPEYIADLEPENWHAWFKGTDDRRIIDGFDAVETVAKHGDCSIAFCFYPEMYPNLIRAVGERGFHDFIRSMPVKCIDGYLYDSPTSAPWSREQYAANIDANLNTIYKGVPSREVAVFRWFGTSGESGINSLETERMMTDVMHERRLTRGLWWVGCDTEAEAKESIRMMTPERLAAMREGGGA